MLMENHFSSGVPHIHSLLSGLLTEMVVLLGEFQSQFAKWRYLRLGVCNRKCVIFQTKRVRCALNKEVLDLLNEESISGVRSGRASL